MPINPEKSYIILEKTCKIHTLYPRRNLSKLIHAKYIRPYLLKELKINRPDQAWSIDITYVPVKKGFIYLTAIIDIYSRYIVAWDISNSMDAKKVLDVLKQALAEHGKPGIINSDQRSLFTCALWTEYLGHAGITISMDGKAGLMIIST